MEVSPGEKVTYNKDNNEYTTEVVDINILQPGDYNNSF